MNARHHLFFITVVENPFELRICSHSRSSSSECVSMIQETSLRSKNFAAPCNTAPSPPSTSILTTHGPSRSTANESSVQWLSSSWSLTYCFINLDCPKSILRAPHLTPNKATQPAVLYGLIPPKLVLRTWMLLQDISICL